MQILGSQQYNFTVKYTRRKINVLADWLSRCPKWSSNCLEQEDDMMRDMTSLRRMTTRSMRENPFMLDLFYSISEDEDYINIMQLVQNGGKGKI